MKKAGLLQLQGTVAQSHPTWSAVQIELSRRQRRNKIAIIVLIGVFLAFFTLFLSGFTIKK